MNTLSGCKPAQNKDFRHLIQYKKNLPAFDRYSFFCNKKEQEKSLLFSRKIKNYLE